MVGKTPVFALPLITVAAMSCGATFYCDPTKGSPRGDGKFGKLHPAAKRPRLEREAEKR